MSETAGGKNRRKRKSRVPAGEDLVMGELLRRGFEARFSDRKEHVLLVQAGDSAAKPVQVKTVHSTRWYVRRASFAGSAGGSSYGVRPFGTRARYLVCSFLCGQEQ